MSLHHLAQRDARLGAGNAALVLLRAHLDARDYRPCLAAAQVLQLPARFEAEGALAAAAAAAVAQTFGLLDASRAALAADLVRSGLQGAADAALQHAAPDEVLLWAAGAAEWCERNGLDRPFSRLQAQAALADARASAWSRVHWRIASAWHHEAFGRGREVAAQLLEALAIAEASGDPGLQAIVWLKQARLALSRSVPDQALALARQAAARADERTTPLWLADVADVECRVALIRGDPLHALHQARRCQGLAELAAAPPSYTLTYQANEVYALIGLGSWDAAVDLVQQMAAIALPQRLHERVELLACLIRLVRDERCGAWSADSTRSLREAMRRLRELDWSAVLGVLPQVVARLWARALEAGIETDWVRASIRSRDLPAPEPAWPRDWPWAVRVQLLGPFACSVNGHDLLAGADGRGGPRGKGASKTLALLRYVAAVGGYDGVASEEVARALWPGEGREGRDKALETTLGRLRKLLDHADAVLLHERRLRLNPRRVWLDTAALARCLERLPRPDEHDWAEALALWRGAPMADEEDAPWLTTWRRSWRLRMVAALAAAREMPWHEGCCLRAVAADPGLAPLPWRRCSDSCSSPMEGGRGSNLGR
jgi:hypothetical protein